MGKIGFVAIGAGVLAVIAILFNKNKIMEAFKGASENVYSFISSLEGFYDVPYWDYSQWSVGYGSGFNWDTNTPVTKDTRVDKETAKRWLLAEAEKKIK